ncbi:DUF4157 domain-containing protein [Acaryochloris sp. CCMEE 5410]|uniref:eCIS core domain-containing protein n=1 Tax=Acaryochloris sp. CCMEE 5410 TaxID=310037 RepID=UPI001F17AE88|nr:DUF4157 domain-containing protein [Acaryochloris sp. CCMEE 5410]
MKRTHSYKPEKSKSQPIPQPISSDQAQSATPVPPPLQAKTNEEGLAEWKAQQEKWERFGTPWKDKVPNPSGELVQPWIQRKLTLGEPGDKYEQEADRVASQVVHQINAPSLSQFNQGQSVQQEKELEGEMQAKSLRAAIQRRQAMTDEEASADLESAISSARGGGQPLDAGLQQPMGQAMGADFSGVRVHTDVQSDQLNQSIQARAFTTGQDVFFRQGEYQPTQPVGQELIAHELTHVVQQQKQQVQRNLIPLTQQVSDAEEAVVQRQVVLARDKPSGDFVELTSINYAVKRAGRPVGVLKDADFSKMGEGETLYIVAHGAPGESGDYTADEIVNKLFSGSKALQNKIKGVYFTSCYAGKGETDDMTNSVVAKIKTAFDGKGWSGVTVSGARGPSIKSDEVGDEFAVVDPNQKGIAGDVQKLLEKIYEPRQKTKEAIEKAESEASTPLTLEEKAAIASRETGKFYKQFIASLKDPVKVSKSLKELLLNNTIDKDKIPHVNQLIEILEKGPDLLLEPPMLKLVSQKKFCFITTACVEARGLSDDCYELQMLRDFRDTYMRTIVNGDAMIERYYDIAPKIVASIKEKPNASDILGGLYKRVVESVKFIEAKQYQKALQNYIIVVRELEEEYL